jgi:hypothetical protein
MSDVVPSDSVSHVAAPSSGVSRKRGRKASYWKYCSEPKEKKNFKGKVNRVIDCLVPNCKMSLVCNTTATSNVRDHFEKYHKRLLIEAESEAEASSQVSLPDAFRKGKNRPLLAEDFHDYVAKWVVEEMMPFASVDKKAFRQMFQCIAPSVMIPSSKTVKSTIMSLYSSTREETKLKLQSLPCKVSYTTDIWTSPAQVPYMAITAHFIEDWKLKSLLLDFVPFTGKHSGQLIKDAFVKSVVVGHKLEIFSVTLDNASNNDK